MFWVIECSLEVVQECFWGDIIEIRGSGMVFRGGRNHIKGPRDVFWMVECN